MLKAPRAASLLERVPTTVNSRGSRRVRAPLTAVELTDHFMVLARGTFASFLALAASLLGQTDQLSDLNSERIDRLTGFGKLWATIDYFHPYLAYSQIDWDTAFVKSVPRVNPARTAGEYTAAVEEMLSVLHDPVTCVLRVPPEPAGPPEKVSAILGPDGILTVLIRNYRAIENYVVSFEQLRPLPALIRKSKGVIFDLRVVCGWNNRRLPGDFA